MPTGSTKFSRRPIGSKPQWVAKSDAAPRKKSEYLNRARMLRLTVTLAATINLRFQRTSVPASAQLSTQSSDEENQISSRKVGFQFA